MARGMASVVNYEKGGDEVTQRAQLFFRTRSGRTPRPSRSIAARLPAAATARMSPFSRTCSYCTASRFAPKATQEDEPGEVGGAMEEDVAFVVVSQAEAGAVAAADTAERRPSGARAAQTQSGVVGC